MCVCVCVREREGDRGKERERKVGKDHSYCRWLEVTLDAHPGPPHSSGVWRACSVSLVVSPSEAGLCPSVSASSVSDTVGARLLSALHTQGRGPGFGLTQTLPPVLWNPGQVSFCASFSSSEKWGTPCLCQLKRDNIVGRQISIGLLHICRVCKQRHCSQKESFCSRPCFQGCLSAKQP